MARNILFGAVALAIAAAVAVPIVLLSRDGGTSEPTRAQYLAQVDEICRGYEARFQQIGAPTNFANPAVVKQSVGRALPLVVMQVEEIRAVEPPKAMRDQVARMLAAQGETVATMRRVLAAANAGDVPRMAAAFGEFFAARDAASAQSRAVGITC